MPLRSLYGVAGLGPVQLASYLTSVSGGCAVVIKNKVYKTGPLPVCPSVVFSSVSQFLRNHNRATKDHIAFVVDSPELLDTIDGLLSLGYTRLKDGHYAYTRLHEPEIRTCLNSVTSEVISWKHKPVDPLLNIIKDDAADSVITKLRSLLYAVPNKDARSSVTTSIFNYLTGKIKLTNVMFKAQAHLGPKTCLRIKKLLKSGNGKELRLAYAKYKSNPSNADRICKVHRVSMFTLRYLEAKSK